MADVTLREKLLKIATSELVGAISAGPSDTVHMSRAAVEAIATLCVQYSRDLLLAELKAKLRERDNGLSPAALSITGLLSILEEL
jgi:hypothetical protein